MRNSQHQSKEIIITGMHRSGTSLFASYMNRCGLNIGDDLIGPASDNIKGYFEDKEFVDFHIGLLKKNKTSMFLPSKIKIDYYDLERWNALLSDKPTIYAWKDPRSVIFLDFYRILCHNPGFILVYRHPYHVIDSLIRRKTDKKIRLNPFLAAKSWIWYTKKIINFASDNPDKALIINIQDLLQKDKELVNIINNKMNLRLCPKDISEVMDKGLMKETFNFCLKSDLVIKTYKNQLDRWFAQLEKIKTYPNSIK